MDDAKKAIQLKQDEALPHLLLGNVFKAQNELQDAITEYTHAIRWNPDSYSAFGQRAEAYAKKGNYTQAVETSTELWHTKCPDSDRAALETISDYIETKRQQAARTPHRATALN